MRRQDDLSWAPELFTVSVVVLLLLSMARQLLAVDETRRLYRLVTEAADERRRLLAEVMHSVDEDRHRVASQLHDQAIFSYVAFDSMTRTASDVAPAAGSLLAGVSARVRDDLAAQAESLRQLMLAVRPLSPGGARSQATGLRSPVRAYVDSLYGDARAPELRVEVDEAIHLDWTTGTILLRIVQEAVGNVARHATARELVVSIAVVEDTIELTVTDDGDGFDPAAVRRESGIATMRSFAALAGATFTVDSRPGDGTTVRVRFGDAAGGGPPRPRPRPPPPDRRPRPLTSGAARRRRCPWAPVTGGRPVRGAGPCRARCAGPRRSAPSVGAACRARGGPRTSRRARRR